MEKYYCTHCGKEGIECKEQVGWETSRAFPDERPFPKMETRGSFTSVPNPFTGYAESGPAHLCAECLGDYYQKFGLRDWDDINEKINERDFLHSANLWLGQYKHIRFFCDDCGREISETELIFLCVSKRSVKAKYFLTHNH